MYHKQTNRFSEARIDEEVVLMDLASGTFFSLTGTAQAIWTLIDGSRDRAAILMELRSRFNADPIRIAEGFDAFVAQLRGAGFIADD